MCSCRFDVSMGEGEPRILEVTRTFSAFYSQNIPLWWESRTMDCNCGGKTSESLEPLPLPPVFCLLFFFSCVDHQLTPFKKERACVRICRDSTAGRGKGDACPCCSWSWEGGRNPKGTLRVGPMEAALRKRKKSNEEVAPGAGVGQECLGRSQALDS